jgi:transposase
MKTRKRKPNEGRLELPAGRLLPREGQDSGEFRGSGQGRPKAAQRECDLRLFPPDSVVDPFDTKAVRASTSTDQMIESPGSSPSTVTTDCGTVVLSESDPETAKKAFDSNLVGTSTSLDRNQGEGHKVGPSVGSYLGQRFIYTRRYRSRHRPMPLRWDEGIAVRDRRALEQLALRSDSVEPIGTVSFKVRSSTGRGFYRIGLTGGVWECECPDWDERRLPCRHIMMVLRALDPQRSPIEGAALDTDKRRYTQNWPAYDKAHQSEPLLFDSLIWDLLGQVEDIQELTAIGRRGRPSTPIRVQLLVAAKYVHSTKGSRAANGELEKDCKAPDSILDHPLNITAPSRLFNRPGVTELLLDLIERSAMPLAEIEDGGTVAIDSTGFCVECRGSYCTEKHDPGRRHTWVKAHLIVGTKTHIILSAKVTDEHGGDSPQFLGLLRRVIERGHKPAKITADKAYLSDANIEGALKLGVDPKIPFKVNSVATSKSSPAWRQKYHEFMAKRPEFDREYHLRSNIESVNSSIKRTLGERLLSHNVGARFNELLMRLLCYNVGVIVEQAFEKGIYPSVRSTIGDKARPISNPVHSEPCETNLNPANESGEYGEVQ